VPLACQLKRRRQARGRLLWYLVLCLQRCCQRRAPCAYALSSFHSSRRPLARAARGVVLTSAAPESPSLGCSGHRGGGAKQGGNLVFRELRQPVMLKLVWAGHPCPWPTRTTCGLLRRLAASLCGDAHACACPRLRRCCSGRAREAQGAPGRSAARRVRLQTARLGARIQSQRKFDTILTHSDSSAPRSSAGN